MSLAKPELFELLGRIRKGDGDAARELLQHFEQHVRRVVRRRLPVMMRSKFDSMDFVQSVWGEFFPKLVNGEIDFDSPERLAKFLGLVAQAKVVTEYRRRVGKKFDLQKEVRMGSGAAQVPGKGGDPTPSQQVVAEERFEIILSGRPELHRRVLELRSQGYTFNEIAEQLGIDERSARRILHGVEKELGLGNAGQ